MQKIKIFTFYFCFFFFFNSILQAESSNYRQSNKNHIEKNVNNNISSLINKNKKAVVSIMCLNLNQDYNKNYFSYKGEEHATWGSGFLITENGYIVTNNHVVDNNKKITVKYNDVEYEAQLVGQDYLRDIAVIKINSKEKFEYVDINNHSKEDIDLGENIIVIGNPYNYGISATHGIVSALKRTFVGSNIVESIQTDASIENGYSGGPVFDVEGKIVGIAFVQGGQSIGFVIPVDKKLISVIQNLIDFGYNQNGYIGIDGITLNNFGNGNSINFSNILGYNNISSGILVTDVKNSSPSEKAGLLVSDIITSCEGKKIESMEDFNNIISNTMISSTIELNVLRNGKNIKFKIKVVDNPYFNEYYKLNEQIRSNSIEIMDMFLSQIDNNLIEKYNLSAKKGEGMYILDVKDNGLAANYNIKKGDILLTLNQKQIKSRDDILKFSDDLKDKKIKNKDKNLDKIIAIVKKVDSGKSEIIFLNPNYFIY